MQTVLLSEDEFLRTYADPMADVTDAGDAVVDIWPYFEAIPRAELGPLVFEDGSVEYVWRSADDRYDHVLLPGSIRNVYLVIVVARQSASVYGHHVLDLNAKYGLAVPALLEAWPEAQAICAARGVEPEPLAFDGLVAVALSTLELDPLNGLRVPAGEGECGWFIWGGGEMSKDPEFFQPLHAAHLADRCPVALRYLALPTGWRFLLGKKSYVDVWFDPALLE